MSDTPIVGMCVCSDPEQVCGGELYPTDRGYCDECAALASEDHCWRCPFDCCTQITNPRGPRSWMTSKDPLFTILMSVLEGSLAALSKSLTTICVTCGLRSRHDNDDDDKAECCTAEQSAEA